MIPPAGARRFDESGGLAPVGVIGLGLLGTALCERLLGAGYPVFVYNRSPGSDLVGQSAGGVRPFGDQPLYQRDRRAGA